jgi:hypothetical protein
MDIKDILPDHHYRYNDRVVVVIKAYESDNLIGISDIYNTDYFGTSKWTAWVPSGDLHPLDPDVENYIQIGILLKAKPTYSRLQDLLRQQYECQMRNNLSAVFTVLNQKKVQ